MGKIYVRILFRHLCGCFHISPACGKDHLTSVVDTFFYGFLRCGSVAVIHDLAFNLIRIQTEIFLHSLNSEVVSIGIAASFGWIRNIENANFHIIFGDTGLSGIRCLDRIFGRNISLIGSIVIGSLS